ncbi:MAG TPA: PA14 domain-containing protein, partial [Planctomycetota bacterium]|nr:PA14 domain-containing protein [Planctomycetota bacterium]
MTPGGAGRAPRSLARWAAAALLASGAAAAGAPPDSGEEPALKRGLRAEIFANAALDGPAAAVRVDPDLQFDWEDAPPDLRVPPGPFSIRWTGRLFAADDGEHEI